MEGICLCKHAKPQIISKIGDQLHLCISYHNMQIAVPMRVFKLLGVEVLIVTNAAGGLTPECSAGSIMMMKDHINFAGMAGQNPLIGPNEDRSSFN